MNNKELEILYKRKIYQDINRDRVEGKKKIGITNLALNDEVFFIKGFLIP